MACNVPLNNSMKNPPYGSKTRSSTPCIIKALGCRLLSPSLAYGVSRRHLQQLFNSVGVVQGDYLKDERNPKRVSGSYSHIGIHSIKV